MLFALCGKIQIFNFRYLHFLPEPTRGTQKGFDLYHIWY